MRVGPLNLGDNAFDLNLGRLIEHRERVMRSSGEAK
jgi:hypothetical protein